jgi:hypothetical protein
MTLLKGIQLLIEWIFILFHSPQMEWGKMRQIALEPMEADKYLLLMKEIIGSLYAEMAQSPFFGKNFKKLFLMPFDSSRRAEHEYARDFACKKKLS